MISGSLPSPIRPVGTPLAGAHAEQRAAALQSGGTTEALNKAAKDEKKLMQGRALLQRGAQRNVAQAMMLVSPKKRA